MYFFRKSSSFCYIGKFRAAVLFGTSASFAQVYCSVHGHFERRNTLSKHTFFLSVLLFVPTAPTPKDVEEMRSGKTQRISLATWVAIQSKVLRWHAFFTTSWTGVTVFTGHMSGHCVVAFCALSRHLLLTSRTMS